MTRFPTYPTDILSRADALLSSKYPDGIVDPRFVEIACEAMMAQREFDAGKAEERNRQLAEQGGRNSEAIVALSIAKAIRGTE